MSTPPSDDDDALKNMAKRLDELEARTTQPSKKALDDQGSDGGYRAISQMIGGLLVGLGLGWLADHFLGASPWGTVAGVIAGLGLGVYLIAKTANK